MPSCSMDIQNAASRSSSEFGSKGTIVIRSEVIEPEALGQAVEPVLFGNRVARIVLRGADGHRVELGEGGAADGGIAGGVLFHEVLEQVGPLQDDAATRGGAGQIPEVL